MDAPHRPTSADLDKEDANEGPRCGLSELAPPDVFDPVVEIYKQHIDRTLLLKNLDFTPAQRAEKLVDFVTFLEGIREAGKRISE